MLINGCINDLGAFQIVNPANSLQWVEDHTKAACDVPVASLLSSVAHAYPKATIVIPGYYQIISELSDVEKFLEFLQQFFPEDTKRMQLMNDSSRLTTAQRARTTSADNCKLFYDESNTLIANAVGRVNSEIGTTRIYFVKIPFAPKNAFGAPNSYLWPIPTVFSGLDEVYLKRQLPCFQAFPLDPIGFETCRVDPTAHPNVAGAQVYADEIVKVLQSAWSLGTTH